MHFPQEALFDEVALCYVSSAHVSYSFREMHCLL